jgi:hypothetical protein
MAAWRERLTGLLEAQTGLTVQPRALVDRLEENAHRFEEFRKEASELAYWSLDYFGGRPQEMQAEKRARLAQRSRVAFIHDPLAGAEADLRANFALGQGVSMPKALDEKVQEVIEEAWTDPNNWDLFTSPAAQRRSSNSLLTQGNLLDTLYTVGGRIKVGKLNVDEIHDIVPDPEHRLRPIYYIGRRRTFRWDVEHDRPAFEDTLTDEGRPRVTYYPHWRNLKDAVEEREENRGLEPLPVPPEEKRDPGGAVVYHTAINQLDEQLWGNPPWARTLRFYSAMNQFMEARVSMAQAASTFIAKRVSAGGQSDIVKAAGSVLSQTGELGAARFPGDGGTEGFSGGQRPVQPGAWWVENEKSKLESLSLNSGAAAAAQDAQIIRSPLAAASGFGQHYLGDAGNANLATATSLELPSLMAVLAWQQIFEDRLTWFAERAVEAAVNSGRLGGSGDGSGKALSELRLSESEDRAEAEKRTGLELGFTFSMPYPGRRNLPDVTGSITGVLAVGGGILAENEEMMSQALTFLFTHGWQVDDPAGAAERVLERHQALVKERVEMAEKLQRDQMDQERELNGMPPQTGAQGGEPAGRTPPKNEMGVTEAAWLPPEVRREVGEFGGELGADFVERVVAPTLAAAAALPGSGGGGPEPTGV